jgi:hypothetical protein
MHICTTDYKHILTIARLHCDAGVPRLLVVTGNADTIARLADDLSLRLFGNNHPKVYRGTNVEHYYITQECPRCQSMSIKGIYATRHVRFAPPDQL